MVLGDWEVMEKTGSEFHRSFDLDKHTGPITYDPAAAIILSVDENVNPALNALVCQVIQNQLRAFNELVMASPRNTVEALCDEFKKQYPKHKSGLILTGDATSLKADTKIEKEYNFFKLILDYLKDYKPSLRIGRSNPSVIMSGRYLDTIFEGKRPGVSILIGSNCSYIIKDMMLLKTAPDGTKLKEMKTDPKTKTRFQLKGHHSDALTYFLVTSYASDYESWQRGSTYARPRFGSNYDKKYDPYTDKKPHRISKDSC